MAGVLADVTAQINMMVLGAKETLDFVREGSNAWANILSDFWLVYGEVC